MAHTGRRIHGRFRSVGSRARQPRDRLALDLVHSFVVGIDGECGAQEQRRHARTQELLGSYRPIRGEEGCLDPRAAGNSDQRQVDRGVGAGAAVEWSATSNPGFRELDADPVLLGFRLVPTPWVPRLAVRCGPLPVSARATAGPFASFPALVRTLGHVRQQRKLARALDCARDLALMAAARSRDPARADLAALGDEAA